jgi:hypothetical protein
MSSVKVFQVGFNKCATRTLAQFFLDNGHAAVHYKGGRLAWNVQSCKEEGSKPLAKWDDQVLFSDMEYVSADELIESYKDFAYLDQWYPDAYFILNTRRVGPWMLSRMRHDAGDYLLRYMAVYGVENPLDALKRWQEDWDTHIPAVRAYFADRPGKLLEFDIDQDSPEKIVTFFKGVLELDPEKWGHVGRTVV